MVSLRKKLAMSGIAAASILGVAVPVVSQIAEAPAASAASACFYMEYYRGTYTSGPNTGTHWIALKSSNTYPVQYRTVSVSTSTYNAYYYGKWWSWGC